MSDNKQLVIEIIGNLEIGQTKFEVDDDGNFHGAITINIPLKLLTEIIDDNGLLDTIADTMSFKQADIEVECYVDYETKTDGDPYWKIVNNNLMITQDIILDTGRYTERDIRRDIGDPCPRHAE